MATYEVTDPADFQTTYNSAVGDDIIECHWNTQYDTADEAADYISLNRNGSSGHPITIINGAGHTPGFTNSIPAGAPSGAIILSGNYNILDGCDISDVVVSPAIDISGDYNIVQNCTFSNNETNAYPGAQGYSTIWLLGQNNIFQNNVLGDSGHSAIILEDTFGDSPQYNQILNNTIEDRYGQAICLLGANTSYNLIDGNLISDSGSLCVGGG